MQDYCYKYFKDTSVISIYFEYGLGIYDVGLYIYKKYLWKLMYSVNIGPRYVNTQLK